MKMKNKLLRSVAILTILFHLLGCNKKNDNETTVNKIMNGTVKSITFVSQFNIVQEGNIIVINNEDTKEYRIKLISIGNTAGNTTLQATTSSVVSTTSTATNVSTTSRTYTGLNPNTYTVNTSSSDAMGYIKLTFSAASNTVFGVSENPNISSSYNFNDANNRLSQLINSGINAVVRPN